MAKAYLAGDEAGARIFRDQIAALDEDAAGNVVHLDAARRSRG